MAVSQAQKMAVRKYRRNNYETVSFEVRKGIREEYKQAATRAGLSLAEFFKQAAESYIANHAGEEFKTTQDTQPRLSASEKELLEVFNRLPDDAQKGFIKGFKAVNQLIESALDERKRYRDYWITASDKKNKLEEELEKLKKNQPQNQAL